MGRSRMNDQVETAVGLYTSMRRPWEGAEADGAGQEPAPETSEPSRLRLFLSSVTATMLSWLAGIKSVLPEGWF